eukprot:jgi/Mesvir1/7949/Mv11868-RA.1
MRAGLWFLAVAACLCTLAHGCQAVVDEPTVQAARASIGALLSQGKNRVLIPRLVRLAFHDCVGGCDGCVDLANPDNNGLRSPIEALDPIVTAFSGNLTRADIWALAGLEAARMAQVDDGTSPLLAFRLDKWGRVDCGPDATGGPPREMPGANWDTPRVLGFFGQTFGLSARETVALMGAHNLGRASRVNSGFDGPWVQANDLLENAYYRELAVPPWFQSHVNNSDLPGVPDRIQWVIPGRPPFIMLNADISLFSNISASLDVATGVVNCTFRCAEGGMDRPCPNQCPPASTRPIVEEYIQRQDVWLTDFEAVLQKMIETVDPQQQGGVPLQVVLNPNQVPVPAPAPSPSPAPSSPPSSPPPAYPPVPSPPTASPPVTSPPPPSAGSPPFPSSGAASTRHVNLAIMVAAVVAFCKMMSASL